MKTIARFLINKVFIASLFVACFMAQAKLEFVEPFTITEHLATNVKRVQDSDKAPFIAKFHFGAEKAIAEALSAQIGIAAGININEVECINIGKDISDQVYYDLNAQKMTTLHSIVPGREVYRQSINDTVSIRGGLMGDKNFKALMAFKTLCPIVALDIFTDNHDRHNGNLFFDELSQDFYAIDMDYAFCKITNASLSFVPVHQRNSMALNTYTFLKECEGSGKKLSESEREALQEIKSALEKTLAAYSPKRLYDEWMELASRINRVYTPREKIRIALILNKQYYKIVFLHAQLAVLTNTTSREYRSEAILCIGERIMQYQSHYQKARARLSEKYEIVLAHIRRPLERLGSGMFAKYHTFVSRLSRAVKLA